MQQTDQHKDAITQWITERTDSWRQYRENNYRTKWNEYYRLWRGVHIQEDKNYDSEQSKLITPALQQAIEASVAELEEATFGSKWWFDVENDYADDPTTFYEIRNLLKEDLELNKVPDAICEVILNAALYGTGIAKIVVEENTRKKVVPEPQQTNGFLTGFEAGAKNFERLAVKTVPIHPNDFIADPAGRTIDEMLGCAHEMLIPAHIVKEKQKKGIYKEMDIGEFDGMFNLRETAEHSPDRPQDFTKLLEWHGLVPRDLLGDNVSDQEVEEVNNEIANDEYDDLVEAICTIANEQTCLKKVENPFLMQDRSVVAFSWDRVPNRFYGRGVAEKGYNPQKALDAETRGRIDAMALQIRPMLAMNAATLPRGFRLDVKTGRNVMFNGNPKDAFAVMGFGDVSPHTFHQSGDLERMVQMGTGAMDSATNTSMNPRNSTASGMSMIQAGAIKRSKRTNKSFSENFIQPLVEKSLWRYQQFNPEKYPPADVKFIAKSTLGIMAREFESQQLTQLLQTTEPQSPGWWMLIRGIYQHSSIEDKEEAIKFAEQMLQKSINPQPDPMAEKMKQLEVQEKQATVEKIKTESMENQANAQSMMSNSKDNNSGDTQKVLLDTKVKQYQTDKKSQTDFAIAQLKSETDKQIAKLEQETEVKIAAMQPKEKEEKKESKESKSAPVNIVLNEAAKKKFKVKRTKDGFDGEMTTT